VALRQTVESVAALVVVRVWDVTFPVKLLVLNDGTNVFG
jgi:hypothetical protein